MSSSSTKPRRGGGGWKRKGGKIIHDILTLIKTRLHISKVKMSSSLTKQGISEIFTYNSSSSASIVGSNVDILTLILTRLPSKSLLVFKSVSKDWCSMISDPRFVQKHFIQNPRFSIAGVFWEDPQIGRERFNQSFRNSIPESLWDDDDWLNVKPMYNYIFLDGNTSSYVPFKTLTFAKDEFGIGIEQSCNGLLLCKSCAKSDFNFTYYIFNPFTNKYKILPHSQMTRVHNRVHNASLAFDPFKSPYYKVVAFWKGGKYTTSYKYRIEIYDSETSSWRLSRFYSCKHEHESIPKRSGIFWNGSLYWRHSNGSTVYFDIDRELVGVVPAPMPSPTQIDNSCCIFDIAECRGCLYLFERGTFELDSHIRIFEMDAATSSWNFKGQVDMSLNPYGRPSSGSIIFIIERGEEKESTKVVLVTRDGMVISYDLKDMSFEKIYELSARPNVSFVKFHQNIESLACV